MTGMCSSFSSALLGHVYSGLWEFCSQNELSVVACNFCSWCQAGATTYYLCRVVVSAVLQKGSSCRCSAVSGVGGFCHNSCVEETQWGSLDRIRSTGIVRIEGKFGRYRRLNFSFLYFDWCTSIHFGLRVKSGLQLVGYKAEKCGTLPNVFSIQKNQIVTCMQKRTCNANPGAIWSAEWGLNIEAEGGLKKQVDCGSAEAMWTSSVRCNCSEADTLETEYFRKQSGPWVVTPVERISRTVSVPACRNSLGAALSLHLPPYPFLCFFLVFFLPFTPLMSPDHLVSGECWCRK